MNALLAFCVAAGLAPLLIGIALGAALRLIDPGLPPALTPLAALGAAWIGGAFGATLRWRVLRRVPRALWIRCSMESALVTAAVALAADALARFAPILFGAWRPSLPVLVMIGAAAGVTGRHAVTLAARAAGASPLVVRRLSRAAWLDTIASVAVFLIALAYLRGRETSTGVLRGGVSWLVLSAGSGVLIGLMAETLLDIRDRARAGVAALGALWFAAGLGYAAELSPLVVSVVAAAVLVHRAPRPRAVAAALGTPQGLPWGLLAMVAGTLVEPRAWPLIPVALALSAVRLAARGVGAALLPIRPWAPHTGFARAAQGPMAVAMAADCALSLGGVAGAPSATLILVSWCVVTVATLPLTRRALAPRALTAPPPLPEVRG